MVRTQLVKTNMPDSGQYTGQQCPVSGKRPGLQLLFGVVRKPALRKIRELDITIEHLSRPTLFLEKNRLPVKFLFDLPCCHTRFGFPCCMTADLPTFQIIPARNRDFVRVTAFCDGCHIIQSSFGLSSVPSAARPASRR